MRMDGAYYSYQLHRIVYHLMTDTSRILNNISSAFFLASGCWADLLIIRIFLTCAYAFILAFYISIDVANIENYIWCMACLYLHGSSAVRLILDEGSVELDESKEQVKNIVVLLCVYVDVYIS